MEELFKNLKPYSKITFYNDTTPLEYDCFDLIFDLYHDFYSLNRDTTYTLKKSFVFDDDEFNKIKIFLEELKNANIIDSFSEEKTALKPKDDDDIIMWLNSKFDIKILFTPKIEGFDLLGYIAEKNKLNIYGDKIQKQKISKMILSKFEEYQNNELFFDLYYSDEWNNSEDIEKYLDGSYSDYEKINAFKTLRNLENDKIIQIKETSVLREYGNKIIIANVKIKILETDKLYNASYDKSKKEITTDKEINTEQFLYTYNKQKKNGSLVLKSFGEYVNFTGRRSAIFLFFYKKRNENKFFDYKELNLFLKENDFEEIKSDGLNKDIKTVNKIINVLTNNELKEIILIDKEKNEKDADINVYKFNNLK